MFHYSIQYNMLFSLRAIGIEQMSDKKRCIFKPIDLVFSKIDHIKIVVLQSIFN